MGLKPINVAKNAKIEIQRKTSYFGKNSYDPPLIFHENNWQTFLSHAFDSRKLDGLTFNLF